MYVGKPSPPEELVGRQEEVEEVVSKMKSKIGYNVVLIGYRRIGKSSILTKVEDILSKDKKTVVVNFDVQYNLGEPKTFLKNLQSAIFDAYLQKLGTIQKLKVKTKNIEFVSKITSILSLKKIKGIGIEISTDTTTGEIKILPKLEFGEKENNYRSMFEAVFSTVNALADESNMKFVIILDEFQDLTKLKRYKGLGNIIDLFRGVLQQRSKNVSYIICGSHVHLFETLLSKGESSLFQHFTQIPIGEMKENEAIDLFNKYLKERDRKPDSKLAKEAYDMVGGHPYYLMALAEEWKPNIPMSEIFEKSISSPVGVLRLYANYVISESMSRAQGGPIFNSILTELAKSDTGMSYSEIGEKLGEPATSIVPYMNELVKVDLVKKEKNYYIRDKVVKKFLRHKFS